MKMAGYTTPGPFEIKRMYITPHEPVETNLFTDGGLEAIIDEGNPAEARR